MKSSNKQILVVGDRVLIRPDTGESKSPAGLYLPPSVIEKQEVRGGIVVEVGPGIPLGSPDGSIDEPWKEKKSDVKYIPTQAEIGDYALFLGKASIEIKIEEKNELSNEVDQMIKFDKKITVNDIFFKSIIVYQL